MLEQIISQVGADKSFKVLFDHATIGIVVGGKRGIINLANTYSEKIFGYKKGELKGKPLNSLFTDGLKKIYEEHYSTYFKSPKERSMGSGVELLGKRKDGTLFPIEISLGHYDLEEGIFVVNYIKDISIRKKSEEALKESEKKYRFVFDNSMDVHVIYEVLYDDKKNVVDLLIKEANPLYKGVLLQAGIKDDGKEHSIKEFQGNYLEHLKECQATMKNGKPSTHLHHNPETDLYILVTTVPMDDNHCFVYGIDVTAQKRSENELNKLNKELEHRIEQRTESLVNAVNELAISKDELVKALEKEKELNELKSRFVTTASHEFRTPLAAILSSAAIIKQYNEKEEEAKRGKHIERIESSVGTLIEILGDFLSLDKLEEGAIKIKAEPLHLEEFIRSIIKENKFIMKKDQKVNYRHIGGKTEIETDHHIFKNIILNLFSNAVKYSPEKKPIYITTRVENGMLELKVKDHGMGIPDKDQKHLFTRFFRAKNAMHIEGTGLGLNIIKKYIELMKGGISFNSTLGEGTVFTIKIPVKV